MRTLAEMNANPRRHGWPFGRPAAEQYTMRTEYAVGLVGHARSGDKRHLIIAEYVEAIPTSPSEHNRMQVGGLFSAHSPCNGNGQRISTPIKGLDTDAITCKKCGG